MVVYFVLVSKSSYHLLHTVARWVTENGATSAMPAGRGLDGEGMVRVKGVRNDFWVVDEPCAERKYRGLLFTM